MEDSGLTKAPKGIDRRKQQRTRLRGITDLKVLKKSNRTLVLFTAVGTTLSISLFYVFITWSTGFTSSVDFCSVNCHEMSPSFREWQTSSHYDNSTGVVAECADCHLPPSFLPKMKAKIYFGIRDTLAHYFGDPENLDRKKLSEAAAGNITDDSCKSCHKNPFPSGLPRGGFLAHSRLKAGEKGRCVDCHKQLVHQNRIYFG
ncbi:MAG: cytochrome c3 family protein [Nitrospinota bacterium]